MSNDAPTPVPASPAADASPLKAPITEIFSSLQGEGLYLGERHIFIRFAGCPWRCRYCDTPDSLSAENQPTLTVQETLEKVADLAKEKPPRAVSLTGGEPLLQVDFIEALLPPLKSMGHRVYLETSATHPHLLRRVLDGVDVVAADIKLPSAIGRPFWAEHEEFLRLAGEKAFVKVVLTDRTTDEEIEDTLSLLTRLSPVPPLVLQPVTPISDLSFRLQDAQSTAPLQVRPPSPPKMVTWWEWAKQKVPMVKMIPQLHPVWGMP